MSEVAIRASAGPTGAIAGTNRLRDVDILRGFVIVLMALDHVRDYFHAGAFTFSPLDPERTHLLLYTTRWITHLCAPAFVLLAGVAAFLRQSRIGTTGAMSRYLLVRGLWLIALEVTIISFGWAFAFPFPVFLQVIWAIGCAMIALAALVWLPPTAVLAVGIAIVAGHNLLDPLEPKQFGSFALVWQMLHEGGLIRIGAVPIGFISYPALPWIGVMALGYGLGPVFLRPSASRDRIFGMLGLAMVVAFVVLRASNLYGDPRPWELQGDVTRTVMAFLDVDKYPPSLMYVLITLGAVFLLLPLLSRLKSPLADLLLLFGSVPLFFYVVHIYFVHALAILANAALGRNVDGLFNFFLKMTTGAERYLHLGFPLVGVYVAWIVVLALMVPACRWWAGVKRANRYRILAYL